VAIDATVSVTPQRRDPPPLTTKTQHYGLRLVGHTHPQAFFILNWSKPVDQTNGRPNSAQY